jgi:hypothetical protein
MLGVQEWTSEHSATYWSTDGGGRGEWSYTIEELQHEIQEVIAYEHLA